MEARKKPKKAAEAKKSKKRRHSIKSSKLTRFLLLLATVLVFLFFMSYKFGLQEGLEITVLVWTFFVLCTPLAVADLLLDVPIRMITRGRMITSHTVVWLIAIFINIVVLYHAPGIYNVHPLLEILRHVLVNPIPYWSLMGLCLIGTFLSLEMADEVVDEVEDELHIRRHKHHTMLHYAILTLLIAGLLLIYDLLIKEIGIEVVSL